MAFVVIDFIVITSSYKRRSRENKHMFIPMKVNASNKGKHCFEEKGARCDSHIYSHSRCSRATWVILWNVAPHTGWGRIGAVHHSPNQCLPTLLGTAGTPSPEAWISLPGWHCSSMWILLPSLLCCVPRPICSVGEWRCRLLLTTRLKTLLPRSWCTRQTCVADAEKQDWGRWVIWGTEGYDRPKAALDLTYENGIVS